MVYTQTHGHALIPTMKFRLMNIQGNKMNLIELSTEESVKVKIIDEQHENIANTVNDIHSSLKAQKTDAVNNLLTKFLEELETHFETEENLMKENRFQGYITHKLEHDRFYNQILQSTDKYKKDAESFNEEQLDRIKRWFFNHIEINDKKCGTFLNSIGIY